MLYLSKITVLHIFYCFGDDTTKKNNSPHETSQTSAQYIWGYFYLFFNFICNFFPSHVALFSTPKKLLNIVRNRIKKVS